MQIEAAGDYHFSRDSYQRLKRVEEIDFSLVEGGVSIDLTYSMLNQAKSDKLTFTFDNQNPISLKAADFGSGELWLKGAGTVQLSDVVDNLVRLVDDALLIVRGGAQSDTIIAGNGGMVLDGGAGDDLLVAGAQGTGADTVHFGAGYDVDTVQNFDGSEDVIALEGLDILDFTGLLQQATQTGDNIVFDFGAGDSLTVEDVQLSTLTSANFTIDGEVLPEGPTTVEIAVGTSAAEFNQLIAGAEDGTTFVLGAGTHVFATSIVIDRNNITIEGSGSGDVTVLFDFPDGTGGDGFIVRGNGDTYASTLPNETPAGSTVLTLRDGHGFVEGDAIYIQQPNDQAYLDANGWTNVSMDEAQFRPFRESIHRIESVEGNTILLATPVAYDLEADQGRYYQMDLTSGIHLSGFTITFDLGSTDTYDFTNTKAEFEGTSALLLENTSDVKVTDVHFSDVASTALNLTSTIDSRVDNVSIGGSHNKGGGGNGYGVELHEAFNNELTNLDIFDMRHSVVLSAWHAEVDNVIEINATNRDINLHGSPDHGNTISVVSSILDYQVDEQASGGDSWMILSAGGTNHALTDISANDVTFQTAIASNRNDVLLGSDTGSVLDAGFGYDTLIGGSSNDVLIGGTRKDLMTGGGGSDTFLLVMGDDLDTITDFSFSNDGISGDTIIFSNNPNVTTADDLTITADGNDVRIRYGSNSTVILKDTSLDDIDASHFQFDPAGLISSDDFLV
ncbi:MAG: hypothetical protein HRU27_00950 [Rhizobiaceae bacterium]|nr:hypothetical protein [Rhizobiaceae bacterium]